MWRLLLSRNFHICLYRLFCTCSAPFRRFPCYSPLPDSIKWSPVSVPMITLPTNSLQRIGKTPLAVNIVCMHMRSVGCRVATRCSRQSVAHLKIKNTRETIALSIPRKFVDMLQTDPYDNVHLQRSRNYEQLATIGYHHDGRSTDVSLVITAGSKNIDICITKYM